MEDAIKQLVICPLCRHKTFKGDYNHEIYINKEGLLACSGEETK